MLLNNDPNNRTGNLKETISIIEPQTMDADLERTSFVQDTEDDEFDEEELNEEDFAIDEEDESDNL